MCDSVIVTSNVLKNRYFTIFWGGFSDFLSKPATSYVSFDERTILSSWKYSFHFAFVILSENILILSICIVVINNGWNLYNSLYVYAVLR